MDKNCKDSASTQKISLNKSASFSGSPIAEKYEIKQLFKNNEGDTIVRHYSYEIPDRRKPHVHQIQQLFKYTKPSKIKGRPIQQSDDYNFTPYEGGINKEIPNVKFGTPFNHLFNFAKHVPEEQGFENFLVENKDECTPMDIDTSIGSNKSTCDFNPQINDELKKNINFTNDKCMSDVHHQCNDNLNDIEHKSKVPKLNIMPKKSDIKYKIQENNMGVKNQFVFRIFQILCFFFIPVTFGLLCMFCKSDSGFIETFDSTNIISELRRLVYGQHDVLEKLEYNMKLMNNNKIFLFTGGIGVGKTYTAQIIERNYPFKNNIQKIIMSSFVKYTDLEKEITNNLVKNGHNLIILDGLVIDDIYFILPVVNGLSASGTRFIMILIFNIQEVSEDMVPLTNIKIKGREISKIFFDNNIVHSTFMFENLNLEDTKECIKYAMHKRDLIVNDHDINHVLESINYKYSGCKGVYGKVALLA